MSNPIYNALNKDSIISQFEQFKSAFTGDPKEEVQKLLDSGRMSQEEYNYLSKQATELMKIIGKGI